MSRRARRSAAVLALAAAAVIAGALAVAGSDSVAPPATTVLQSPHLGGILAVAISPGERFLATGGEDRTVRLWDASDGGLIRVFAGPLERVEAVAFSPDGTLLAAGGADHAVTVWVLATGEVRRRFDDGEAPVTGLAFSPDGERLGVATGREIRIYQVATGETLATVPGHSRSRSEIAFIPGSDMAAVASGRSVRVIEFGAGRAESFGEIATFSRETADLAVSPDGRYLAAVTDDHAAWAWDRERSELAPLTRELERQPILAAVFAPGGRLWTATPDRRLLGWEVRTGTLDDSFPVGEAPVRRLVAGDRGRLLAMVDHAGAARVLETESGRVRFEIAPRRAVPTTAALTPDGRLGVVGHDDGSVDCWSPAAGIRLAGFAAQSDPVRLLALTADGRKLATAGRDGWVQVWDLGTGSWERRVAFPEPPRCLAFSPDGRVLAGGWPDRVEIRRFGRLLAGFDLPNHHPVRLEFTPDGSRLLSIAGDGEVVALDPATGAIAQQCRRAPGTTLAAAAISPDGRTAALAPWDYTGRPIQLVDLAGGRTPRGLTGGHPRAVTALAFDTDGGRLLTGCADHALRLWETGSGRLLRTYRGHTGDLLAVGFLADGRPVSSGRDGTLRVWAADRESELISLQASGDSGWTALSPDGRFNCSDSARGRIAFRRGATLAVDPALFEGRLTPVFGPGAFHPTGTAGPAPRVRIETPVSGAEFDSELVVLAVRLADAGGGVGALRIVRDGIVLTDTRLVAPASDGVCRFSVPLEPVGGREQTIRIAAYDRTGGAAAFDEVRLRYRGPELRPRAHIVAVGINEYRHNGDLQLARGDAESFLALFQRRGSGLYRVNGQLLADTGATADRLAGALGRVAADAGRDDLVVFYFAGHGISDAGDFYFVTHESPEVTGETAALRATPGNAGMFSARMLMEQLAGMAARRVVVIIDSCQAGGLGRIADLEARFAALDDGSGVGDFGLLLLVAATGSQNAMEVIDSRAERHALFTAVVLEALAGQADGRVVRDGAITVEEIRKYIEEIFPRRAAEYPGIAQSPLWLFRGTDFPVATGTAAEEP